MNDPSIFNVILGKNYHKPVANLEGAGDPLFGQNLPSNISKTEDLRPKIPYIYAPAMKWPGAYSVTLPFSVIP
jgi:hypothetical protein